MEQITIERPLQTSQGSQTRFSQQEPTKPKKEARNEKAAKIILC
jgi:hypothetical protein